MTLPLLTVIEASAGTGKTFALVTRLLQLIFNQTEPERIVALTFSRMAAGEIFNSFIERLSRAAADPATAAAESERVGQTLTVDDFRAMLRKVISRQHLSLIGTLDSFLMRIVRMIPLELGLEGEVAVMSDYRSPVERLHLVGEIMMLESEDAKAVFREAFRLAFGNAGAKGFLGSFSDFIKHWHTRYRDLDDPAAWGIPATIWGKEIPADLDITLSEIRSLAMGLERYREKRGGGTFVDAVANFSGSVPKLPVCLAEEPLAQEALRKMRAWRIALELGATQGIYRLMHTYESAYAVNVRAHGRITFDDMPRLINALDDGVRLPIEYRMDATFEHWALDEFQDTSRGQWKALQNLIDESSQPGQGKSVFIVGDRKQSIYEWRGGDVRILGRQVERAKVGGNRLDSLDESHRYLPAISEAVNAVFGEATVCGAFDMDSAPEGARWRCRKHVSHDRTQQGFVEVIQATKAGRQAKISDFFAPIENTLNAVRPWERGISTAILVRKNDIGEAILAYLKSRGMTQVVFEGDSKVSDSPVLATMAELVQLAEHADDAYADAHIRLSPLAAALYPDGLPAAAELSAQLLEDFTRIGMVRKFREVREALKAVPGSWNDFTEARFEDFIKCAAEFEEMREPSTRLSDFIAYLSHKTRRDYAEPGMVRIMTMHQSKGLGFDQVIIPFFEHEGLLAEQHIGPLESENPRWLLDNPGTAIAESDPVLGAAERRRQQIQRYNALCLDYVAMTRAKKALTLILHPLNKTDKKKSAGTEPPARFSDLVRMVGLETNGDRGWYLNITAAPPEKGAEPSAPPSRRPRQTLQKSRPSQSFHSGMKGDRLFEADFGAAAKRGVEIHGAYEQVAWLDPAEAHTPLERALVRPEGAVALWRERSYELVVDGVWQSGQFDRVVFTEQNGERRATICDFKTNRMRGGETPETFAARMRETYAGQMRAYRTALTALTGIPPGHIALQLLLTETRDAVALS